MQKSVLRSVGLVLAFVLAGSAALICCSPLITFGLWGHEAAQGKKRFDALDEARPHALYISDFLRLFPESKVQYSYFGPTDEPGVDLKVELYGRYEFSMQLQAHFDPSRHHVVGYGEPQFYLLEIETQKGLERTFNDDRRFGAAEWQRIVDSHGDFGAIGYTMIKDQPVPGYENLLKRGQEE